MRGSFHIPVMAEAVVAMLAASPAGIIVDGTVGGGGHLLALADAPGPERLVVGVDKDRDALAEVESRLEGRPDLRERVRLFHGDFRDLAALLGQDPETRDEPVAGVLVDLGVSSHQLDVSDRGFGLKHRRGPLDMRMDQGASAPTALELLESWEIGELADVLRTCGEVPQANRVARGIHEAMAEGEIQSAGNLADLVERLRGTDPRGRRAHPATTVFQALRIAVNGELEALDQLLADAEELLIPGGRLAVIAYHSLEDRRVKHAFRRGSTPPPGPRELPPPPDWRPSWEVLTPRPVVATDEEIARNPRARSARLRVAARPAASQAVAL